MILWPRSKTSLVYNGVVQNPDYIIVDANGDIIAPSNYTVTYAKGCKNVGKYTATITFKGNYEGTNCWCEEDDCQMDETDGADNRISAPVFNQREVRKC